MDSKMMTILTGHPFFKELNGSFLQFIVSCAESKTYKSGDYLFRYQKSADEFFILLQGSVLLLNNIPGKNISPLETISAPNIVGWSWVEAPFRWHFDARAQTDINCLSVAAVKLRVKMNNDREFGFEMYRRFFSVVVDRLQASRLQAMDVYAKPASSYL